MPDPRFFKNYGPFSLQDIAELTGAKLTQKVDPEITLVDVMPLNLAEACHLSFFDNVKYKKQFQATKAGACFASPEAVKFAPKETALLVHASPYKAYALAAQKFYPENKPKAAIAKNATIHKTAKIAKSCVIGAGAVIAAGAVVNENCWIEPNVVIGKNVVIGSDCRIGANTSISHASIGSHVRLYPGVRVGQDGFGFAIDPKGHVKVPQLGRVIIEDHVEIGANTTIDRGAGPDTVIGQGTWIDNLVQIGHNAKIGKGCIIVAQAGVAGSTVIGDFVAIGGQAGIAGHLTVGKGARIAAQSGVMRDIPTGEEYMGYPALPIKQFMRQIATLNRLIKKDKAA